MEAIKMLHPYDFIASEIYELESLLASIPEGNIIEKMSLESRLEQARERLSRLPVPPRPENTDSPSSRQDAIRP
jgi:hypothetical protein